MSDTITMIPLSKLQRSIENTRKTQPSAELAEIAASIEAHGLLQNLIVRQPRSEKALADGQYEVVAGGRRLAALTFDIRRDQDTLVHELVHHLQNVHGRQFKCPAEREREAYLIQARFVAETGTGTMPTPGFIASLRC